MKKISAIISAVILAVSVSMTASAESVSVDCRDFTGFYDGAEFARVLEQMSGDDMLRSDGASVMSVQADTDDAYGEYKCYRVGSDFLKNLADGASVKELLPDEYVWKMETEYSTATVGLNDNNEWCSAGVGYLDPQLVASGTVDSRFVRFDMVNSALEEIGAANVQDVFCVELSGSYTNLVCIQADNVYIVPFCSRPDFTGLENGKLYTAAEVNKIWSEGIGKTNEKYGKMNAEIINGRDISELTTEEILSLHYGYGGTGAVTAAQTEIKNEMPILPIVIIPAAVIAAAITITMLLWRKSDRKIGK